MDSLEQTADKTAKENKEAQCKSPQFDTCMLGYKFERRVIREECRSCKYHPENIGW